MLQKQRSARQSRPPTQKKAERAHPPKKGVTPRQKKLLDEQQRRAHMSATGIQPRDRCSGFPTTTERTAAFEARGSSQLSWAIGINRRLGHASAVRAAHVTDSIEATPRGPPTSFELPSGAMPGRLVSLSARNCHRREGLSRPANFEDRSLSADGYCSDHTALCTDDEEDASGCSSDYSMRVAAARLVMLASKNGG